jgi:8-oxo-dGTP diphosphatase
MSSRRIKAVCGFMFSADRRKVALIRKNRPNFQAGKLNGIGGKAERGELNSLRVAMVREFREETSMVTHEGDWLLYARILTPGWDVRFYRAFGFDLTQLQSLTDELIEIHNVSTLNFQNTMRNVQWLVPLALDNSEYVLPHVFRETEPLPKLLPSVGGTSA